MNCDIVFTTGSGDKRRALLTRGIDTSCDCGIEIGALNNPIIKPEDGNVKFVDYTTTEMLQSYPHAETVKKNEIVEVDYVWSGSGSLAKVVEQQRCFDYAIASHVIEHVPNVLGWFQGIAEVLKDGGVFNFAIPDRRFTFDVARKDSTLGEAIEAYLMSYKFPSIRQEFDHCYEALAVEPGSIWQKAGNFHEYSRYSGNVALQLAFDQAQQILAHGRYYDCHCWVFTPLSFIRMLQGATQLGIFPFTLSSLFRFSHGCFMRSLLSFLTAA